MGRAGLMQSSISWLDGVQIITVVLSSGSHGPGVPEKLLEGKVSYGAPKMFLGSKAADVMLTKFPIVLIGLENLNLHIPICN